MSAQNVPVDAAMKPWPERNAQEVIEIALTYLPIDCGDLYEGCLSSAQAHDGALRVLAHLGGCGFSIIEIVAGGSGIDEP